MNNLWNNLSGNTNNDIDTSRRQAEMKLVQRLLDVVLDKGQELLLNKRQAQLQPQEPGPRNDTEDMTSLERAVFNHSSYYGWTEGGIAGIATFAVLFGGLRLASRGRIKATTKLPVAPKQSYSELDQQAGRRTSKKKSSRIKQPRSSPPPSNGLALEEDVVVQLQFICTGAMALGVVNLVASRYAEIPKFYRELAQVPLQPGTSSLCHDVCPILVQQLGRMQDESAEVQTDGASYSTRELVQYPETPQLESMVEFVQNCKQRITFEAELRKRNGLQVDSPVSIPEPGVPANYLGVEVQGSEEWADSITSDQSQNK